ncbi:MAG: 4Fe-4S binding protein [Spirochaetota bacterium]|nr:4Fe-4S binding protein [Spirochaetota bacterium]
MSAINRREFFQRLSPKGFSHKAVAETLIRPPYCGDHRLFTELCPKCPDRPCQSACGESIIAFHKDNTPFLNLVGSGCTFCRDCLTACERDVLTRPDLNRLNATAQIAIETCLAWNQVVCDGCRDVCDSNAISYKALWSPEINSELCAGCGHCLRGCPVSAIQLNTFVAEKTQDPTGVKQ